MQHPAKIKILSMGRRWGKTFLAGDIALALASQGATVGWVAPTYRNSIPLWRWVQPFIAPLRQAGIVATNKTEMTVEFLHNRGLLSMFSADNSDGIRGWSFHLLMVDEAARIKEDVWQEALQPTLADYDGRAYLISTPKGRNWFWREYQACDGDERARWKAPSFDNPNPSIKRAYELARQRVPERVFKQEWDAEFIEDSGQVFRRVNEAATAEPQTQAIEGHTYIAGVDLAKTEDFTVITVIDVDEQALVYIDRFNQIDYQVQLARLHGVNRMFQPEAIVVESNNVGDPLIEIMLRDELPVIAFKTTNASKANAIESLQLAFEQGILRILDNETLLDELQSFAMERLPSGMIRYSAPTGLHDDCVMSLAFAWHGAQAPAWDIV